MLEERPLDPPIHDQKGLDSLGACALLVDAKDDEARRFDEHFGFRALRDAALTLYLPLGRG